MSGEYSQKLLDCAKQSTRDALKTALKKSIQKTEEATSGWIGIKIVNKITKVSKISPQNNSKNETEIIKERYISPEERQKIIDELRWIL